MSLPFSAGPAPAFPARPAGCLPGVLLPSGVCCFWEAHTLILICPLQTPILSSEVLMSQGSTLPSLEGKSGSWGLCPAASAPRPPSLAFQGWCGRSRHRVRRERAGTSSSPRGFMTPACECALVLPFLSSRWKREVRSDSPTCARSLGGQGPHAEIKVVACSSGPWVPSVWSCSPSDRSVLLS